MLDGDEVALPAKSFDLLVHLVRHRDRIVPKSEIVSTIWPGVVVSDAAVASAVRDLRRALGDRGASSAYVSTFRSRGLRFVHEVEVLADAPVSNGASAWEAAAVHFERALDALDMVAARRGEQGGPPRERAELLVALAQARWAAGSNDAARQAFVEAARVARAHGNGEVLSHAALGFVGRTDVTPGVHREAVALLEEALDALGDVDSPTRSELIARLGTELVYGEDPAASDRLTRQALAMAERTGHSAAIAYAATARHFAMQRPEVAPTERLTLNARALELVRDAPASDVQALALQQRWLDFFELGEGTECEACFARFEAVTEALEQPFFHWLRTAYRGTRALLRGEIDRAEGLAHESFELGRALGTDNAEGVFAGQMFAVRREQGRLGELVPALAQIARQQPALPIYRAGLAAALAGSGAPEEARSVVEAVMKHDLDDFPRDQNWVATLGTLAPAVALAGSEARKRQMLGLLEPFRGRMIVVGQGATTHGAVDHHLGLLQASLGELEPAIDCFEAAIALHTRCGAPLWIERSRRARRESQIDP
jgi:DNA-binding winged helix-turn-helix (wHTH) protein